jgi:hypothetical protein
VHIPDPVHHTRSSSLRVVNATPWPWRFNLTQRMELVRADGSPPGPQGPKTPSGIPVGERRLQIELALLASQWLGPAVLHRPEEPQP